MARRDVKISITTEGRDKGKTFLLTEMGAMAAEWWATRAMMELGKANPDLGDITGIGMDGVAALGFRAFFRLSPAVIKPLLDEMMECVQMLPDPSNHEVVRALVSNDIEEIDTLLRLRMEVFNLHVNFSLAEFVKKASGSVGSRVASSSRNTRTSRQSVGR